MGLIDALNTDLPTLWPGWMNAILAGAVALIVLGGYMANRRTGNTGLTRDILPGALGVVAMLGLLIPFVSLNVQRDHVKVQIVAEYLASEHDLVVLEPVKVRTGQSVSRVATPAGELRWAHLTWLPNPEPVLAGSKLPASTDIVTLDLSETEPDTGGFWGVLFE